MYQSSQAQQNAPGEWTQPQPQSNPWAYQQPTSAPWMSPDQYINQQMQMAAMYSQPYAAAPSYGSFFRRFGALIIDMIIVLVLFFIGGFMVGLVGGSDTVQTLEDADRFGSAGSILSNMIMTAMIIGFNAIGGTPGKRMLGLRITNQEGGLPGFALATIRAWPWIVVLLCNLAYWFAASGSDGADSSLLEGVSVLAQVIWFIGCFFVLGTKYKQTLHDKLAGTYVIKS
jgi:uncharacterized RDD family membrane protein YckC